MKGQTIAARAFLYLQKMLQILLAQHLLIDWDSPLYITFGRHDVSICFVGCSGALPLYIMKMYHCI